MEDYQVYYLAILCDCDYDEDSNVIGNMCKYCKEKDDIARKSEWYEEIKTIKKLLYQSENISADNRIPIIRKIFEYILTRDKFIARNSSFRKTLINKIEEFKLEEKAANLADVFNKMDIYLEEIKKHPEYKN